MKKFSRALTVITFGFLIVMATLHGSSLKSQPGLRAERQLERAAECGLRGDFTAAINLATAVIDEHPAYPMAYLVRGTAYRRCGKYDRAVADLNRVIEFDAQNADAFTQRAFAYQQSEREGTSEQILADASRAIELDSSNALAFLVRGKEHTNGGDFEVAMADLEEALRLNPSSYSALANRGMVHFFLDRVEAARQDLQDALELAPADERSQIEEMLQLIEG